MVAIPRILRRLLGRTRFGLYALREGGARPVLLVADASWPPARFDPAAFAPLLGSPDRPGDGRFWNARELLPNSAGPRDLVLMPLDAAGRRPGVLFLQATPRSAIWKMAEPDLGELVEFLELRIRSDAADHGLALLRRFHDALLPGLPLGVMALDRLGRVAYLSPPAEEILGYRNNEAVGVDCLKVFRPAGVEENPIDLGFRGKATKLELYIADRHGREKPVWLQMIRLAARGGEVPKGMLVLIRDTSEERAFEDEMRRRERLASIGELSAGVAHEIRNPLTGIGNCAQVLRDRIPVDDPKLRFVQIILEEAARLNRIVDSLLSFARPSRPQLRESDVIEILRHVAELEEEALRERGISHETKLRGRIPRIYIDPEQITQVLLNVIRNAAEAMPSGGRLALECSVIRRRPHVRRGTGQRRSDRIRIERQAPMMRYVQIRVGDTGRGIAKDTLPRIFDPFFTTRTKGTGLGLSITQSIIKEHGGFISVRSIESKGTTVLIDLPVERRHGERRRDP
jgi:signal transduction histidine kinase